jgi:hypothetical protein
LSIPERVRYFQILLRKKSSTRTELNLFTRDGRLSILIRMIRTELRASTRSLVSISTDHSTSDQDFHSRELLSATVPTMSG